MELAWHQSEFQTQTILIFIHRQAAFLNTLLLFERLSEDTWEDGHFSVSVEMTEVCLKESAIPHFSCFK